MLGTSAEILKYQTLEDFRSPADYLEYMYSGVQGVIYRALIDPAYKHSYYRSTGLAGAKWAGVDNCYISMNTFYRSSGLERNEGRSVELLKRLNAFYVDIDYYKLGLTKNDVLMRLQDDYIGNRIPEPTFIIDSGRGIYLIWKLRNEDKNALPRWTAVQQYLIDSLAELGADQACKDAARVLRVPGSRNPKSNSRVAIIDFCDLTYSIYDIAKEYGIKTKAGQRKAAKGTYGHATERQRKYVRDIAKRLGLPVEAYPDFTNFHETDNWIKLHRAAEGHQKGFCWQMGNIYSLSEYKAIRGVLGSYCAEIRKLLTMRKGEDCKREIALFLYRYFMREMGHNSKEALKETLAFNADLDCPFSEAYVIKRTASADRRIELGIPYAYKKSTIIKLLEISEEELKQLPFLSAGVKSRTESRKERNRRNYESRRAAAGKVAKVDAVLERRAKILAMLQEGKTAKAIQAALQIGKSTYYRDCEALESPEIKEKAQAMLKHGEPKKTAQRATGSAKKRNILGAIRAAHTFTNTLFPKIQRPIYEVYSFAVLHGPFWLPVIDKSRRWLVLVRSGGGSAEPSGDAAQN